MLICKDKHGQTPIIQYWLSTGNQLVTTHHLIELSALRDHCLKVLITSIVAVRRWIRKQRCVGQGWSVEMGKGIGESACAGSRCQRTKHLLIRVEKIVVTLGNLLLWWNDGVIFITYFLGKSKCPLSFWGTEYPENLYRSKEKAWVFFYKIVFLLLFPSIFPPWGWSSMKGH